MKTQRLLIFAQAINQVASKFYECPTCNPGFELEKYCDGTKLNSSPDCIPCVEGKTFSDFKSQFPCQLCPICSGNEVLTRNCTTTRISHCECLPPNIRDGGTGNCIHCCELFCKDPVVTSERETICGNLQVKCDCFSNSNITEFNDTDAKRPNPNKTHSNNTDSDIINSNKILSNSTESNSTPSKSTEFSTTGPENHVIQKKNSWKKNPLNIVLIVLAVILALALAFTIFLVLWKRRNKLYEVGYHNHNEHADENLLQPRNGDPNTGVPNDHPSNPRIQSSRRTSEGRQRQNLNNRERSSGSTQKPPNFVYNYNTTTTINNFNSAALDVDLKPLWKNTWYYKMRKPELSDHKNGKFFQKLLEEACPICSCCGVNKMFTGADKTMFGTNGISFITVEDLLQSGVDDLIKNFLKFVLVLNPDEVNRVDTFEEFATILSIRMPNFTLGSFVQWMILEKRNDVLKKLHKIYHR